jgi:hypothetical protein
LVETICSCAVAEVTMPGSKASVSDATPRRPARRVTRREPELFTGVISIFPPRFSCWLA